MPRKPKNRIRTHPGEDLLYEFMEPLGLSARALAAIFYVPPNRLTERLRGVVASQRTPHSASVGTSARHLSSG